MSVGPNNIKHTILRTYDEVQGERVLWDEIVSTHFQQHPFLGMDWNLLWLEHFVDQATEITYVKLSQDDEPLAYFPLVSKRIYYHGFPTTALQYAANIYSPICGPLVAPENCEAVIEHFVGCVLPKLRWTILQITDLPAEFPATKSLANKMAIAGYSIESHEIEGNWIWEQPTPNSELYYSWLKQNLYHGARQPLIKHRRNPEAFKSGESIRFRLAASDLRDHDIAAYQSVYSNSWKEAETDPSFHPALMRVAAKNNTLRLGLLFANERPVAAQLWLIAAGTGYCVKTAYDEAFSRNSPGTILTWRIIERLMQQDGMRSFDYLKGDDKYKQHWTNQRRIRTAMTGYRNDIYARVLRALDQHILPQVRNNQSLSWLKRKAVSFLRRPGG